MQAGIYKPPTQPIEAGDDPAPVWDKLIRWARTASFVALIISLLAHFVFLLVSGVISIGVGGGGSSPHGVAGPVEVAVITGAELRALEEGDITSITPGVDEVKSRDIEDHVQIELPGGSGMADSGDIGTLGEGIGGAGAGTGMGVGEGAGGAGGGSAKFFGVEAKGQRFAYIVDISGSMQGSKIETLKRELASSIDALPDTAQFVVCTFQTESALLLGREKWIDATAKNKAEVIKAIGRIEAGGGTEPLPGFSLVLGRVRPRPDAVYFMTDGVFDVGDADRIIRLCRTGTNVVVHGITFVSREGEMVVRKIARDTDGTYTHVPGANR